MSARTYLKLSSEQHDTSSTALEALLKQWEADRQEHFETIERLEKLGEEPRALKHAGWAYGIEQCKAELLAGLRADPAPRQVLEEKDITSRGGGL